MTKISTLTAALALAVAPVLAGNAPSVTGDYVEARTAEVFTGGCTMGSEAETVGRQAVLAWRVASGSHDGVRLDGLSVVAALSGDRNLGIREIGGGDAQVKAAVIVDARASVAERDALVSLARTLSGGLMNNVVEVTSAPISFERDANLISVSAGDATLRVSTTVTHSPSCGAMQWFHPFSAGADAKIGMTRSQIYWGGSLGSKWRQEDKKSAFFGTFSY